MPKTYTTSNELLNHEFSETAFPSYGACTLRLSSTAINPDGTGATEISGALGYSGQPLTAAFGTPAASGVITSDADITFGTASGTWSIAAVYTTRALDSAVTRFANTTYTVTDGQTLKALAGGITATEA